MNNWTLQSSEFYEKTFSDYNKKRSDELAAVIANLSKYHQALLALGHPQQITGKYVHKEPKGIKALDESGSGSKNLQATRLYLYPDARTKIIHLLAIGNKKSQKKDIKICEEYVNQIRSE